MAYQKSAGKQEEFKVNFTSMAQATEWLIVRAAWIRINAAIMGRNEKVSATNQLKMMIPDEWRDNIYKTEIKRIDSILANKQNQSVEQNGKYDSNKLNDALDKYADNTFRAVWNLLSRIGKLPQKSEISEDD